MVRFGIVGFGRIGKRHAEAIAACPDGQLVSICDVDASDVPEGVRAYGDLGEMLNDAEPDIVCVCSPNGFHAEHSITILDHGAHVVCEKPLALNHNDALAMMDAARKNDRHLFCMLQNRYSPQARWLKEIIESGKLGRLLQVQVNCFWNRDKRYYQSPDGTKHVWHGTNAIDGGPLFTQFSHFIDLLIWLFGDLNPTSGRFRNFTHGDTIEFEDAGIFGFEVDNGGIGCFHYSTAVWDKNQESSISLIGSKGSVSLGGQYMDRLDYCHFEGMDGEPRFEEVIKTGKAGNHELVIRNAVEVVRGNCKPDFDIADAEIGVKVIEDVYRLRDL